MRRAMTLATAGVLAVAGVAFGGADRRGPQGKDRPPNVVVVMTDDQTASALAAMPRTQALIGDAGVSFANSFVSFPLCCPSRATFLTGQYAHNHGVRDNDAPRGGFERLRGGETLPVWLRRAGYYTGLIGKYLNGYEAAPFGVPPGYSEWHGSKTQNAYYGYRLLEGGQQIVYGDPAEHPDHPADPGSYVTDVYNAKAVEFISRRAPLRRPFFLWLAHVAPHSGGPDPPAPDESRCGGNAKPAVRHLGAFEELPLPLPPSFNEEDLSDKPPSIQAQKAAFSESEVAGIERFYRCELESLLAVEEGVEQIVDALRASGELERTLLIFTSDNGMLHGEHRFASGKGRPYEESIRVPLLVRGPGVPSGVVVRELAMNADLAPTILDLAGARSRIQSDGRSLLPLMRHPNRAPKRRILIEGLAYSAVRTPHHLYAEYRGALNRGARELYDLRTDPYQLHSLHADPAHAAKRRQLARRLDELRRCAGRECR